MNPRTMEIAGPAREVAPRRRRGERARTIPEQIAGHVAAAIVNGEYRDGERLREQELAELYEVSRGPVREAIRELEKHGLAILNPRRGAYVVGVSLDFIAEAFNIRAALSGVAARYFTRRRSEDGLAALEAAVVNAEALIEGNNVDPITCARAFALCGRSIFAHCGAAHLQRVLRDQYYTSIWGLMWRVRPLDYLTGERRRAAVADWRALLKAARAGRQREAERLFRKNQLDSRDSVIATLASVRGESADPALMFRD
jgi:DNA-binding GntR family transcriptional regulator